MKYLLAVVLLVMSAMPAYAELDRSTVAELAFDPHVGVSLPLNLEFVDEEGQGVRLGKYFGTKPVILSLNYFHCQYLCPIEEDGLISGLNGIGPSLGVDFTLLTVSIDSRDGSADAALIKARALRGYNRPQGASGWHLLTSDQRSLDALGQAVGFHSVHDPQAGDFAHPIGVVAITPEGTISQYLEGIEFNSGQLQSALTGAHASTTVGTSLVCYHFDPLTGQYTQLALNALRVGGAVTVIALAAFIFRLARGT